MIGFKSAVKETLFPRTGYFQASSGLRSKDNGLAAASRLPQKQFPDLASKFPAPPPHLSNGMSVELDPID